MGQYTADVPPGDGIRPDILAFYELFYQISDNPDAHEQYAGMFSEDAKLIMASSEANGRDEIIRMRYGMWEKVAKRSHNPHQLFPFGSGSDDVMLFGTVDYELKNGKKANVEWAARSHFVKDDGELKMDFYQDTAAMSRAK